MNYTSERRNMRVNDDVPTVALVEVTIPRCASALLNGVQGSGRLRSTLNDIRPSFHGKLEETFIPPMKKHLRAVLVQLPRKPFIMRRAGEGNRTLA